MRGGYKCGRCGQPKKGHTCTSAPGIERDTMSTAIQAEIDPRMTISVMKEDPNWRLKGYTAYTERATRCNHSHCLFSSLIMADSLLLGTYLAGDLHFLVTMSYLILSCSRSHCPFFFLFLFFCGYYILVKLSCISLCLLLYTPSLYKYSMDSLNY